MLPQCLPDTARLFRTREPEHWIDVDEYHACGFWLGYVRREHYLAALSHAGLPRRGVRNVTVTPHSCIHKSWLAPCIRWVSFKDLSVKWWTDNVLSSA